ncbi:MAG: GMC family oxidoreductase N-terminal domain-containing protein [Burkholderiaceae bacterium]
MNAAFLEAAGHQGLTHNPDYNGPEQLGCFMYQVTQKNGERCSAAKAFLTPNLSRSQSERDHAHDHRIDPAGRRPRDRRSVLAGKLSAADSCAT